MYYMSHGGISSMVDYNSNIGCGYSEDSRRVGGLRRAVGVHIFLDMSNILISAKAVAVQLEGPIARTDVRVHAEQLLRLASVGRSVSKAWAVAGECRGLSRAADHFSRAGFQIRFVERDPVTRREVDVDESLQRLIYSTVEGSSNPGVVVLLGGDGAGAQKGEGFLTALQWARLVKGWGVEVVAWDHSCHRELKRWAGEYGAYVPLERYYEQVTFLQGSRHCITSRFSGRCTCSSPERGAWGARPPVGVFSMGEVN